MPEDINTQQPSNTPGEPGAEAVRSEGNSELTSQATVSREEFEALEAKYRAAVNESIDRRKELERLQKPEKKTVTETPATQDQSPEPPAWASQLLERLDMMETNLATKQQEDVLATLQNQYALAAEDMAHLRSVSPESREALAKRLSRKTFSDDTNKGNFGDTPTLSPRAQRIRDQVRARADGVQPPATNPFDALLQQRIGGGYIGNSDKK